MPIVKIKNIIDFGKDQFAEVCFRETADKKMSPFEYAVKLKTKSTRLDEGVFRKKYMTYLFEQKEPVSDRTYLEVGQEIDLLLKQEICTLLGEEERVSLEATQTQAVLDHSQPPSHLLPP